MSQEPLFINGELLRLRREAQGWVLNDMATRACMSIKQIRQLEEGGISSFYSEAVKATAARKVGALLGLSTEEVFAREVAPTAAEALPEVETSIAEVSSASELVSNTAEIAQETAPLESVHGAFKSPYSTEAEPSVADQPVASKNSLWLIVVLLGLALAVGAYFNPKEETVVEPPPPLQVLPDAVDPASAASAPDVSASTADVVALPSSGASALISQKSATTAVSSSANAAVSVAASASKAP